MNLDSTNFMDKTQYLIKENWKQVNLMLYEKNGQEIFFDNSNLIEFQKTNKSTKDVLNIRVQTLQDLINFLDSIKKNV